MSDTFVLKPVPPFRLDLTVWALRRRARNIIDRWDGTAYRRVLSLGDNPVEVEVRQAAGGEEPRLTVTVRGKRAGVRIRDAVRDAITRMLGLKADLSGFYALAAQDRKLAGVDETQIDPDLRTGGRAAGDERPGGLERAQAFVPGGDADVLHNNVHTLLVGNAADFV